VVEQAHIPSTPQWYGSHGLLSSGMPFIGSSFDPANQQMSDCSRQAPNEELTSDGPITEPLRACMGGIEDELQADLGAEADGITISDVLSPADPHYEGADTPGSNRAACDTHASREDVAPLVASLGVDLVDHISGSTTAPDRVPGTDEEDMADGVAQDTMDSEDKVKSDAPACSGEMQIFSPASASADEDSDEGTPGPPETAAPEPEHDSAAGFEKAMLEKLLENAQGKAEYAEIFAKFGYVRKGKDSSTKARKANQAPRTARGDQQRFHCDGCEKTFNRPCELKYGNPESRRTRCAVIFLC